MLGLLVGIPALLIFGSLSFMYLTSPVSHTSDPNDENHPSLRIHY